MAPDSPSFVGRTEELQRLHALIAHARNRVGGSLLVHGDPGIGKSTLLDRALSDATAVQTIRISGFEVESTLPYGGLQRLGRPLARYVREIPDRQRDALLVAAGLAEGRPPERPLVGLGVLSVLALAADEQPVVCVVDDAHHLDSESLEVLGFVARRLSAERVVLLFGARDEQGIGVMLAGVPDLSLAGLDPDDAAELLGRSVAGSLDPVIAAEIVAYTGGNPLALRELSAQWDAHRLVTVSLSGTPVPLGRRLEEHYSARVERLSDAARTWLLVAAAESAGDPSIVRAAAADLGVDADAATELEGARLVAIHDSVRFRHPLVRSAVYNAAPDAARRAAHAALRDETARRGLREFSVWHAAAACAGPDAGVAADLVEIADLAGARGGPASRARLLARAAELTADAAGRASLLIGAAEAAISAGAPRLSMELLGRIDDGALDPVGQGRVQFVRVLCALFLSDADGIRRGPARLLEAADAFHGRVPALEQRALLTALNFAQNADTMMIGTTLAEIGRRLAAAVDVAEGPSSIALRAVSSFILEPYAVAVPHLREALEMLDALDDAALLEISFLSVIPAVGLWDLDRAARLLQRTAMIAREAGSLRELDALLWVQSAVELSRGEPSRAGRFLDQASELRRAVGYDEQQAVNAAHMAWIGVPIPIVEQVAQAMADAGFGGAWRMGIAAVAIAEIAEGEYRSASDRLVPLLADPFIQASFHHLAEAVEAGVRGGRRDRAEAAAARIAECADACGSPWALAVHERSLALLADDTQAEKHYIASLAHLSETEMTGELGRGHLLYGEWLRRVRRRRDARAELEQALRMLDEVGAPLFAGRARRELHALGEAVETTESPAGILSPQEAAVARLAARGDTNVEIGAILFISPNTVDYHLRKVFRKLAVSSRRQLAERLAEGLAED